MILTVFCLVREFLPLVGSIFPRYYIAVVKNRRRFRPHVTVARVRHGAAPRRRGLPDTPEATFDGEALTLYRSWLGGGPARYEALERVAL